MSETNMNNPLYTIRNYQPADFDEFVRLNIEAERLEPGGRTVRPQLVAERLDRPGYSPEQDLFVVATAGSIIGYIDVTAELRTGRGWIVLDCWVHPQYRRQGLARKLLDRATRCAQELGVEVARVNIAEENTVTRNVLSRLGFQYVRRFLELRLELADLPGLDVDPAALGCRHLQPGEEGKLTGIQNRSFAGNWEYNPNTLEEVTYRINQNNCCPEDVVITCDGEAVVGYCWTEINGAGESPPPDERKGRISMLGADPDYRGKGVGKRVLLAGLAYLKSKGVTVAELTVDSENKAARALYGSVGFQAGKSSLWYEKPLD